MQTIFSLILNRVMTYEDAVMKTCKKLAIIDIHYGKIDRVNRASDCLEKSYLLLVKYGVQWRN